MRARTLAPTALAVAAVAAALAAAALPQRGAWREHRAAARRYAEDNALTLHAVPSGGQLRYYRRYLPSAYDGATELPVVVLFHGGGGNALQAAQAYGVVEEAEARGTIAVFPEGTGALGGPPWFALETWNAGGCCAYAAENDVDDVQFTADLLDHLGGQVAIDRRRVFATGMSNGAMMSYRVAVERPDLVRAIAPVAGALEAPGLPTAPVPLLAIHGLLDQNVPFEGGVGSGVSGADFTSQVDSLLPFLAAGGGSVPAPVALPNGLLWFAPGPAGGADTAYFLALDGGHTWPGASGSVVGPPDPVHTDTPATPLMFDFFALQSE